MSVFQTLKFEAPDFLKPQGQQKSLTSHSVHFRHVLKLGFPVPEAVPLKLQPRQRGL